MSTVGESWDFASNGSGQLRQKAEELPEDDGEQPSPRHPDVLYTTRRLLYEGAGGEFSRNVFTRHETEAEEVKVVQAAAALAAREQGRAFLSLVDKLIPQRASTLEGASRPRALEGGALVTVLADEESKAVSCSGGDRGVKSVLLCLLKFGTHGVNALFQRSSVEEGSS